MKYYHSCRFSGLAMLLPLLLPVFFWLLVLVPSPIMAAVPEAVREDAEPAMVQRHLFSPEEEKPAENALGPRSEAAAKLEKELLFTGVIHSPRGNWAIIRPRNKTKREDAPWRLSEGDEIKGYHVKEIGPNYIVLVSKDKPVRLDLYRGSKNRPAPPPPAPPISSIPTPTKVTNKKPGGSMLNTGKPTTGVRSGTVTGQNVTRPPASIPSSDKGGNPGGKPAVKRAATPFAELLKRAQQNKQNGGTAPENPFSRMIRQRQNK